MTSLPEIKALLAGEIRSCPFCNISPELLPDGYVSPNCDCVFSGDDGDGFSENKTWQNAYSWQLVSELVERVEYLEKELEKRK